MSGDLQTLARRIGKSGELGPGLVDVAHPGRAEFCMTALPRFLLRPEYCGESGLAELVEHDGLPAIY